MFLNNELMLIDMFNKLNFGTAGVPISSPTRNVKDGISRVKKLGLDSLEIEFVRQVYIKEKDTKEIKKLAEESNIELSCHGQYYINLNSKEIEKQEASKDRIYNAAKIAFLCGAKTMTFHAGFFQGQDEEKSYQTIKKNLKEVLDKLKKDKIDIMIRPETTGKKTQFGSLQELVRLSKELNILPCIDFAHLHAREGKINTEKEFKEVFDFLKNELDCLNNMHIHMEGINYSDKGERNHLCLEESDFEWKTLLKVMKEYDVKGIVTCESPNIEVDALMMKEFYNGL